MAFDIIGSISDFKGFKATIASYSPSFTIGDSVLFNLAGVSVENMLRRNLYQFPASGRVEMLVEGKTQIMSRGFIAGRVTDMEIAVRSMRSKPLCRYTIEFRFQGCNDRYIISHINERALIATEKDPYTNKFVPDRRLISVDYHYEDGSVVTKRLDQQETGNHEEV